VHHRGCALRVVALLVLGVPAELELGQEALTDAAKVDWLFAGRMCLVKSICAQSEQNLARKDALLRMQRLDETHERFEIGALRDPSEDYSDHVEPMRAVGWSPAVIAVTVDCNTAERELRLLVRLSPSDSAERLWRAPDGTSSP
jgi:hypothetical protein